MNKREVGSRYELQAAAYLQQKGMQILEKNYRCRIGEVDLIGRDQEYLVFVEVKFRRNLSYGAPAEAVTLLKQMTIRRVAEWYLAQRGLAAETPCRFDLVGIDGNGAMVHYPDAFGGM